MRKIVLLMSCLLTVPMAEARWFGDEFSADMEITTPGRPAVTGKLFVGEKAKREERQVQGKKMIDIISPAEHKRWLILEFKKEYVEQPLPATAASMLGTNAEHSPCDQFDGVTCNLLGEEDLNGRAAKKWSIVLPDSKDKVVDWTDKEYGFTVKQLVGNEVKMEMNFRGESVFGGRKVEQWETSMLMPDGKTLNTTQYYDPHLNMALRQEMPGNVVRVLKNITLGKQPKSLFEVPPGYRRVKPNSSSR